MSTFQRAMAAEAKRFLAHLWTIGERRKPTYERHLARLARLGAGRD